MEDLFTFFYNSMTRSRGKISLQKEPSRIFLPVSKYMSKKKGVYASALFLLQLCFCSVIQLNKSLFPSKSCVCVFFLTVFFIYFIHLFPCAYIIWAISPTCPPHPILLLPTPTHFQEEPVLPFSPILLKRRHMHNNKDKAFLLVEIRIAIQRDS
jgi:hypothetical protein